MCAPHLIESQMSIQLSFVFLITKYDNVESVWWSKTIGVFISIASTTS